MPYTTITIKVPEGKSVAFDVAFTDDDGDAVTPATVTWTLTDQDGAVINSRFEEEETPAATVTLLLQGDDLEVTDYGDLTRLLLVEWTYNSTLGTGIPAGHQIAFQIAPLPGTQAVAPGV